MDDGSSSPASYIRLVQHLIEKCICYKMNREECMETLEKHAKIMPVITSTVWKELEKENREFFETYKKDRGEEDSAQKSSPLDAQGSASKSLDDDKQGRSQHQVKPKAEHANFQGRSQHQVKPQADHATLQGRNQNQVKSQQAEQANTRLSS